MNSEKPVQDNINHYWKVGVFKKMCTDKIEENCHRSTVWLGSPAGMMLSRYGFEFRPGHALFPSRWHLVALWWLLANIRPFDEVNGREAQQDNYATHLRRGLKMYGSISADAIRLSLSLFFLVQCDPCAKGRRVFTIVCTFPLAWI